MDKEQTEFKEFMQSYPLLQKVNTMCLMHNFPVLAVSGSYGKAGIYIRSWIIFEYRQNNETIGMVKVMFPRGYITGVTTGTVMLDTQAGIIEKFKSQKDFTEQEKMLLRVCRIIYNVFTKYSPAMFKHHFEALARRNADAKYPDEYLRISIDGDGSIYFTN